MARSDVAACAFAVPMFLAEGSTPVTAKPRRAIGSLSSPPPQPMSRSANPPNGFRLLGSRPKCPATVSRMNVSRTGLNLCSGANLPVGSHHSSASAENLATSASSTVESLISEFALSLARLANSDPHIECSRPRPHRRRRSRIHEREFVARRSRGGGGLSGSRSTRSDFDVGPRWLRHLGGRGRRRTSGGSLRHLHRRRRRLYDRPAHRAQSQAAGKSCL